jgi:hypothetical protein
MVESLHTTITSRPMTRPMPVMMPAEWIASSYMPWAASAPISRNGAPGIEEPHHAFARQQLARGEMALARLGRSALGDRGAALLQFGGDAPPRIRGSPGGVGLQINGGSEYGH